MQAYLWERSDPPPHKYYVPSLREQRIKPNLCFCFLNEHLGQYLAHSYDVEVCDYSKKSSSFFMGRNEKFSYTSLAEILMTSTHTPNGASKFESLNHRAFPFVFHFRF